MGWQDRDYNQDSYGGRMGGSLWSILFGSVRLFRVFGITVRIHAWFIIFAVFTILLEPLRSYDYGWALRTAATSMAILFGIVLLHEFGHCFAARFMGGFADDILLTPIGGLAFASPPQRPWPVFVTVACGPLVNVAICIVTATALWLLSGRDSIPFNPFSGNWPRGMGLSFYLFWIFLVSYGLLLFNLLPIFPLDGGQMLQAILWPWLGYYRSMYFACITGMIGGGLLALYSLFYGGGLGLMFGIGLLGVMYCYQKFRFLKEAGPGGLSEEYDYASSLQTENRNRRHLNKRMMKRAQQSARRDQIEQGKIDAILAKVSAHGMHSLTWWEKRTLRKATERQRERDVELSRSRD